MCGINGIFAYNPVANPPDEGELLRTRDAMAARGPDGAGSWWSDNRRLAFGHRRLSIIDLSDRALQPMISASGRYAITFNGEIYNYLDLREELEARGAKFRTTSDTEVLLELFAHDGEQMVPRLRGMFAFAIWDTVERRLFLARDPYGIKPLYMACLDGTFRFASQVKALLAGGQISREPDPAGVVGFFLLGHVPEPFTIYREVRALPAGHVQWIDRAGAGLPKRYVNLSAILASGASHQGSRSGLLSEVRKSVFESVKAHLVSDVEVGVFLSAGINSGALLGLMRDAGQEKIRAITLGFSEFEHRSGDEVPLASVIAERYGAQHVIRRVSEREFAQDLPALLDAMDQPSIDGVNAWFVSKAAHECGLKVALSGLGGDELLAGYRSFVDVPFMVRRLGPIARVPGLGAAVRQAICAVFPQIARRNPKLVSLLEYSGSWPAAYMSRRGLFLRNELESVLPPDFVAAGMARLEPYAGIRDSMTPDPDSDVGRVCALESQNYMRNQLLRDADWAGMAHSLEVRVPFVDIRLLEELAPYLPGLKPGVGKSALAAAPSRPLPPEIANRAKTGFDVPIGAWIGNAVRDAALKSRGSQSRAWAKIIMQKLEGPDGAKRAA